ncbi:MAG: diphthamide synthesis protein [Candidatus Woesearchaeota archaeon]
MKFLFIEAKYNGKIDIPYEIIEKLPKTLYLFMTLQFIDSLEKIKKKIEKTGRKVLITKTKHTKYPGQIYGCNLEKFEGADAFLYIGDGLFHPKALALGNNQEIHIWNPINKEYKVIDKKIMEQEIKTQKIAYSKFLMSKKVGVLISTKPGQSYLKYALKVKEKYPDKEFYFIVMDTIDLNALEDFNFIECWLNTACPRLGWDDTKRTKKPLLDIGTVL